MIEYELERAARDIGFDIIVREGVVTIPIETLNELVRAAEDNGARDATIDT